MLDTANYIIYIVLSIFTTIYVSSSLARNGLASLTRGFNGDVEQARSTNHLLVVGFNLVGLGFVLLRMRTNVDIASIEDLVAYQTDGLGLVLLVLGIANFFNMYLIHRISQSAYRMETSGPSKWESY